jgi:hypothetical protein
MLLLMVLVRPLRRLPCPPNPYTMDKDYNLISVLHRALQEKANELFFKQKRV